jgi:broad specificity phosphatase PhoE
LRLILVRHGETVWNNERRVQGGARDIELSDYGRKQIAGLARVFKDEQIDLILSSPLSRAQETARSIAQHHDGVPILTHASLKEVDVGEFDGMSTVDMPRTFTELLLDWWKGGRERLPGGESFEELQERAWAVVGPYVEQPTYENVLVVSHYFVTLSIVFKAIGLPLDMLVKFRMDPASITALDFGSFGPRLAQFNDTSYLALSE